MSTVYELVADARRTLRQAGIPDDEADLDARLLAERALHWDTARYFTDGNQVAAGDFAASYRATIARRARREPVAYITGIQEFWDLDIEVTPAVLIPRPETELIVEVALEQLSECKGPLRIADVCTGSGCLAIAIARERADSLIVATDVSPDALAIARRNIRRYGLTDRVTCGQGDLLAPIEGRCHAIVSNPPYVPDGDIDTLQPEVSRYEPRIALAAGADGLDIVRRLIAESGARLEPGGWLIFEFGFGQADAIKQLVLASDLDLVAIRHDLQDIPRAAVVRHGSAATRS